MIATTARHPILEKLDEEGMITPAALMILYIISFYTFLDNSQLSISSFALALLMLAVLCYRHLFVQRLRFPRLFLVPWLFVLLTIVSVLWARDTTQAIDEIKAVSSTIIGASAVWLALRNGVPVRIVIYGLVAGSLVLIGASAGELKNFTDTDRLSGLVGNANTMAMYLSYPFFLVWCMSEEKLGRWRLICGGLVLFAFLFTGSRRMLLIVVVQCVFPLVHLLTHYKSRVLWFRVGLASLALVAVLIANWDAVTDKTEEALESNQVLARATRLDENREGSSVYIREKMISVGLQLWAEDPIAGHGAGQFSSLSGFKMYAHNNYIELLTNGGAVGLVAYYALPGALLLLVLLPRKLSTLTFETRINVVITILSLLAMDLTTVTLRSKAYWVFLVGLANLLEPNESVHEQP